MQHIQNFESPLWVTGVQPSVWERVKTKAKQALSAETIAETVFGTVTVLLTAVIFIGLAHGLAHYTIIPAP